MSRAHEGGANASREPARPPVWPPVRLSPRLLVRQLPARLSIALISLHNCLLRRWLKRRHLYVRNVGPLTNGHTRLISRLGRRCLRMCDDVAAPFEAVGTLFKGNARSVCKTSDSSINDTSDTLTMPKFDHRPKWLQVLLGLALALTLVGLARPVPMAAAVATPWAAAASTGGRKDSTVVQQARSQQKTGSKTPDSTEKAVAGSKSVAPKGNRGNKGGDGTRTKGKTDSTLTKKSPSTTKKASTQILRRPDAKSSIPKSKTVKSSGHSQQKKSKPTARTSTVGGNSLGKSGSPTKSKTLLDAKTASKSRASATGAATLAASEDDLRNPRPHGERDLKGMALRANQHNDFKKT